jgi:hypothetical protein
MHFSFATPQPLAGVEPVLKHRKQWMKLRSYSTLPPPPLCQQFSMKDDSVSRIVTWELPDSAHVGLADP